MKKKSYGPKWELRENVGTKIGFIPVSNHIGMDEEGEGIILMHSWERTDRDYEYEEVCTTAH